MSGFCIAFQLQFVVHFLLFWCPFFLSILEIWHEVSDFGPWQLDERVCLFQLNLLLSNSILMPWKHSLSPKVLLVIIGDGVYRMSSDPSQEVSSAQGWLWEGTWG